jgi:hypothetical protein
MPSRKHLAVLGAVVGILALFTTLAYANILSGASAVADCNGYTITVNATHLNANTTYTITSTIMLTCGGSTMSVGGSVVFTTTHNGSLTDTTDTETISGTWPSTLTVNCTVSGGSATLTSSGSTVNFQINGSTSATLSCSTGGGSPKSFAIGPSSMEGDLHIAPGDWISSGYNFKFTSNTHAATMYSVTATVTVPVSCPDGSTQNVIIHLGQPGALNGGGVTTYTYNIAAGDTSNHATNDQNSIFAWEGAVQAPANLCGGAIGRNQTGAVFNASVTQTPHVGLVDWQFHYRDPNAKGKGNVNCTNAADPRRNDAATCGASWSQTVRDP